MLIEFHISPLHEGRALPSQQVTIQEVGHDDPRWTRFYWEVIDGETQKIRTGTTDRIRSNHPNLAGHATSVVLRAAFPFEQENRFSNPYPTEEENTSHGK